MYDYIPWTRRVNLDDYPTYAPLQSALRSTAKHGITPGVSLPRVPKGSERRPSKPGRCFHSKTVANPASSVLEGAFQMSKLSMPTVKMSEINQPDNTVPEGTYNLRVHKAEYVAVPKSRGANPYIHVWLLIT